MREVKRADLSDATVRRLIPRALMAADQVDEAIQEMEELHFLAPGDLENTYALARAYLGQSRLDEAAPLFDVGNLAASQSPKLEVRRGDAYRTLLQSSDRKALHEVLTRLRPCLESDPAGRKVRWSIDVDPIELF